jgi:signal transduction histidine kinase
MIMQLSGNTLDLDSDTFMPVDLLRDAGERMQDRARSRRHRVTVQLDRSLPRLRADYRRTLAILMDLMDNAMRYTPEGGHSRVAIDSLGGYVLFTVADDGVGLSDQDMLYIGQPFWRGLHQPLVRAHRGTGLRLYLARRVLEMQGGALYFSGEPGHGSTFSFTVPVAS